MMITYSRSSKKLEERRKIEFHRHDEISEGSKMEQNQLNIYLGQVVEVGSEEEGLRDSWYSATVIKLPSPTSSPSQVNKIEVEYRSLFTDELGTKPLVEEVKLSLVRPSPPDRPSPSFEINDVVDANYRDGWWTGVITQLVGSSRFVVTFSNPPDQVEFEMSDLRLHLQWKDGEWGPPHKHQHQGKTGSIFSRGKKVEVCFGNERIRENVWFPATVVEEMGNESFLVEMFTEEEDKDKRETVVDSRHIRPSPPNLKGKIFTSFDKVDAFYDFGWWSGVITKEVADNRCAVLFKHTNEERELNHSELRLHMEWRDGNWFSASRRRICLPDDGLRMIASSPNLLSALDKEDNEARGDSCSRHRQSKRRGRQPSLFSGGLKTKSLKDGLVNSPATENKDKVFGCGSPKRSKEASLKARKGSPNSRLKAATAKGGLRKHLEEKITTGGSSSIDDDLPLSAWLEGVCSQTPIINASSKEQSIEQSIEEGPEEQEVVMFSHDEGMEQNVEGSREEGDKEQKIVMLSHEEEGDGETKTIKLPFVKSPSVWRAIESLEVFSRMPQKPHFHDLESVNEIYREGVAVACMVNFSRLVKNVEMLQLDDPRSKIEGHLETLVELQGHGFDVTLVRDRLNQLSELHNRVEDLQKQYTEVEYDIAQHNQEKSKIVEKCDDAMKQLRELKEMHARLLVKKMAEESEINSLSSKLDGINDAVTNNQREYVRALACVL